MEYTAKALADLSGVSPRTLRCYDRFGLLKPLRTTRSDYRIYGPAQVDRLQQILFYREVDFSPGRHRPVCWTPLIQAQEALQSHLSALEAKRRRLDARSDPGGV